MAEKIDELDEEAVKLTAYFLWEAEGGPNGGADAFWEAAVAKHLRQQECDRLLSKNPPPLPDADII